MSANNPASGDLVFSVLKQSFEFKKALKQKYIINEQFLETNVYPKAKALGKITKFNRIDLSKKD